jgi:GPH family glycoside/pentoside/hexuronide:cation symporter
MSPRGRPAGGPEGPRLGVGTKLVFSLGDHTVNLALSVCSLVLFFFLTEIAGLRPFLAGLAVWTARIVDAVSDPLMGRISDRTSWFRDRRRPYFLLGAIPFGVFFSLLWATPFETQTSMFLYYTGIYIGLCLSMTVVSVPYMALIPEMAVGYDERTSLNAFRAAAAVLGTLVAVGFKDLAEVLGEGSDGFVLAGGVFGLWMVLLWLPVYRVSFEDATRRNLGSRGFWRGLRDLARHRTYRQLCGLYISARIAVDLIGLAFVFFFTYWLDRKDDFGPALLSLLVVVILSLPLWLRLARRVDKHRIFVFGVSWWAFLQIGMFGVTPEWPRMVLFALAGLAGIGYAMADLMPWSMLGEVIDEDELASGERREGIYNGVFTFVRKLGGASAVLLAGVVLELAGFEGKSAPVQPEGALLAIRMLTTLVPGFFLALALVQALRYPLGRARHAEILARIEERTSGL